MHVDVIFRTSAAPTKYATEVAVDAAWRALQYDELWPPDGWQRFVSSLGGLVGLPPVRTSPTAPRTLTVIWVDQIAWGLPDQIRRLNGMTSGTRDDPRITVVGAIALSARVSSTALCHEMGHVACWRARGTRNARHGVGGGPFTDEIALRLSSVDKGLRAQGL